MGAVLRGSERRHQFFCRLENASRQPVFLNYESHTHARAHTHTHRYKHTHTRSHAHTHKPPPPTEKLRKRKEKKCCAMTFSLSRAELLLGVQRLWVQSVLRLSSETKTVSQKRGVEWFWVKRKLKVRERNCGLK